MSNVLILLATIINYHKLCELKQQKFILTVLEPEVQNEGVSRATLLPKALEERLPSSSGFWRLRVLFGSGPIPPISASIFSSCVSGYLSLGFRTHPSDPE